MKYKHYKTKTNIISKKIKNKNNNISISTIFLFLSFSILNVFYLFSILSIIFGILELNNSKETQIGKTSSIISIIGGTLVILYKNFIAPDLILNL